MAAPNAVDRFAQAVSPAWYMRRMRARHAALAFERAYDAASTGRRTQGWRRNMADANSANGPSLARLRDIARDLVRNNPFAESALSTIVNGVVGWGIEPTVKNARFQEWANSTDCDADGRQTLMGLTKLIQRTAFESGEAIIRRRWRRLSDGFALPFQLQVLEPDYIDTLKDGPLPNGNQAIQGVEFDLTGWPVAYWLYREHPGSTLRPGGSMFGQSMRVDARDIAHVFKMQRPGQVRGVTSFAPVILRFKDFDEYEDATLVKQKIAACLALVTTDSSGSSPRLGTEDSNDSTLDTLSPGMILNAPVGRDVKVVEPPTVAEYSDYSKTSLRAIAAGLGISYEDMTGDYANLPFSAARMSRINRWATVEDWRYRVLIPQGLDRVWGWAAEAAAILGDPMPPRTQWTPPGMPMIEPDKEGLAANRNIRTGITTLYDEIRARGYNPESFLQEVADGFKKLDDLGLVLDCDPRKMSQQGQMHPATPSPLVSKEGESNEAA